MLDDVLWCISDPPELARFDPAHPGLAVSAQLCTRYDRAITVVNICTHVIIRATGVMTIVRKLIVITIIVTVMNSNACQPDLGACGASTHAACGFDVSWIMRSPEP